MIRKQSGTRVLVCDDHALFREGLRLLLQRLDDSMEVSICASCEKGVRETSNQTFDLILMDWHMEGLSGAPALAAFREAAPLAQLVVLSGDRSPALVRSVVDLGAVGFIPKDASPEGLMLALRTISSGGVYLPSSALAASSAGASGGFGHGNDGTMPGTRAATPPIDVTQAFPKLTERQADVLRSALRGLPNKLIARELGISDGTVKTHLSAVFRELDVQSRTEALYVAAKHGVRIT